MVPASAAEQRQAEASHSSSGTCTTTAMAFPQDVQEAVLWYRRAAEHWALPTSNTTSGSGTATACTISRDYLVVREVKHPRPLSRGMTKPRLNLGRRRTP